MKFSIFILFSFISSAYAENTTSINYSQNKCEIRDQSGVVQFNYAGDACLFLEDGSFIVYKKSDGSTSRVNSKSKVIWKKKLGTILSLELDKNKKTILVLGQQVEKTFICKALSKFLVRIDLKSGKTLSFLNGPSLLNEIVKIRSENKKYFPLLGPLNKPDENNEGYDCVLTGALEVKSIKHFTANGADKMHFANDILLYMAPELATAYILSYDLKNIVWSYELDSLQEEIFKYYVEGDFIHILSFEDSKKRRAVIRKISLIDKKVEWVKKEEITSSAQFINYSGETSNLNTETKNLSDFIKRKK